MAEYLVTDTELTSVADEIRTKGGTSSPLLFPTEFITAIANIPSGGGGLEYETGVFTPSQDVTSNDVTFSNTHNTYPVFWTYYDTATTKAPAASFVYEWGYCVTPAVTASGFYFQRVSSGLICYGEHKAIYWNSSGNASSSGDVFLYPSDDVQHASYPTHPGSDVNKTQLKMKTGSSSAYFRSGRNYRWFVVFGAST